MRTYNSLRPMPASAPFLLAASSALPTSTATNLMPGSEGHNYLLIAELAYGTPLRKAMNESTSCYFRFR